MLISSDKESSLSGGGPIPEKGEYYTHYPCYGIKRWRPQSLPQSVDIDGKQVWEPPVFNYSHHIGEEYEKKREAALKYTKGDRARATEILDIDVEDRLLGTCFHWLQDNLLNAADMRDSERESFFAGLIEKVSTGFDDVRDEWKELGVTDKKMKDGTWKIKSWKQHIEDGFRWTDEEQLTNSYIPPEEGKEEDISPLRLIQCLHSSIAD